MASFVARRRKPELVLPAQVTPHETLALSDVDDDIDLRFLQPAIEFFRAVDHGPWRPATAAKVVKAALAEALVHYYPLAGRLREAAGGKLVVECTGEGVVFVEAEVDVSMDDLGKPSPLPPYPCVEELLCEVGDPRVVVGVPLFFMQVTQLRCGGFVIGLHICHNIADGYGTTQFLKCIADLARTGGDASKIVSPVWNREILTARIPPQISPEFVGFLQRLGSTGNDVMLSTPPEEMVVRFFIFGPGDIAALRSHHAPAHLSPPATSFELLTAVMWRCRTVALGYEHHQRVGLMFSMNVRGGGKCHGLVPHGFYGNALFYPVADTTAGELSGNPLSYTLGLIREAKRNMTDDNMESMVDFMASLHGRPPLTIDKMYEVSDMKWIGQEALDFQWAKRVGGGLPMVGDISFDSVSCHMRCRNGKGQDVIVINMILPGPAMDKFEKEIAVWVCNGQDEK
ncbi:acyl transferase 1-like [Triticum dicoccoides]|uniref:acyl transferase 1-like n=1 Tax=Triticum dicoccoides TaxID=85692 RepID=UPI001891DFEE|nr:acyl transferase 1-like [Triticum dicoccoides]